MAEDHRFELLRRSSVPTLANAIELFGVTPPNRGYNTKPIVCHFPELGMLAATVTTVRCSTDQPPGIAPKAFDELAYWRHLGSIPGPKVVVVQDLDDPPGGAMWGEWNANVHKALGCIGTITNGAVRDLDTVARLRFHVFSTSVSVAHGFGRFVEWGSPVSVAGLTVNEGDVLVADRHGVLRIPPELSVEELVEVADQIDRLESEIFALCQSDRFSVETLDDLQRAVRKRWPEPRPGFGPAAV